MWLNYVHKAVHNCEVDDMVDFWYSHELMTTTAEIHKT